MSLQQPFSRTLNRRFQRDFQRITGDLLPSVLQQVPTSVGVEVRSRSAKNMTINIRVNYRPPVTEDYTHTGFIVTLSSGETQTRGANNRRATFSGVADTLEWVEVVATFQNNLQSNPVRILREDFTASGSFTLQDEPQMVRVLAVPNPLQPTSQTSYTLSWQAPSFVFKTIDGYDVQAGGSFFNVGDADTREYSQSRSNTALLTSMAVRTRYTDGTTSDAIVVPAADFDDGISDPPTAVRVQYVSESSFLEYNVVSWTAPDDDFDDYVFELDGVQTVVAKSATFHVFSITIASTGHSVTFYARKSGRLSEGVVIAQANWQTTPPSSYAGPRNVQAVFNRLDGSNEVYDVTWDSTGQIGFTGFETRPNGMGSWTAHSGVTRSTQVTVAPSADGNFVEVRAVYGGLAENSEPVDAVLIRFQPPTNVRVRQVATQGPNPQYEIEWDAPISGTPERYYARVAFIQSDNTQSAGIELATTTRNQGFVMTTADRDRGTGAVARVRANYATTAPSFAQRDAESSAYVDVHITDWVLTNRPAPDNFAISVRNNVSGARAIIAASPTPASQGIEYSVEESTSVLSETPSYNWVEYGRNVFLTTVENSYYRVAVRARYGGNLYSDILTLTFRETLQGAIT